MISAVILTNNEEGNIKECIKTVLFCDEVLVIDDNSEDSTRGIAALLGAKVYQRKLNSFAAQRNFGLKKAKGDWVLFVDADERVSKQLAREIIQVTNDPILEYDAFTIKRVDHLWSKQLNHGETGNLFLVRLAKKSKGKWKRQVHEYWDVKGRVYTLSNPLNHYPHPEIHDFVKSINWMSNMHAKANLEEGKHSSIVKIVVWPGVKFFVNYILKVGFLDGIQGFVSAVLMSFHSFLAWSKQWQMQKKA